MPQLPAYLQLAPPRDASIGSATQAASTPPPSLGGSLILLAFDLYDAGATTATRVERLVDAMALTNRARRETRADARAAAGRPGRSRSLFGSEVVASYRKTLAQGLASRRGTTHLSVIDAEGKDGFGRWPENRRLASMMCPTVALTTDGRLLALGSGGSNRIRSAILQVLLGMLDDGLSPQEAIARPRVHLENDRLDAESDVDADALERMGQRPTAIHQWNGPNMFFGGVHLVERDPRRGSCRGAGDPRRGGVAHGG